MTTMTLLAAAALGTAAAPGLAGAARPHDVLPDLVQAVPQDIGVETARFSGRRHFRLGFRSATENRGPGPLTLRGWRTSDGTPTMQVDQIVSRSDGSTRQVPAVGVMRYVVHEDHQHWHFLGFERYALRPVGRSRPARRDRKTGFCVGDRYRVRGASNVRGYEPQPRYPGACGLREPGLLEVLVGLTPGWGDDYLPQIEGQYIDVTGLRAGRYRLIHTANPTATIVETDRSDNRASALLRLRWPHGHKRAPRVKVLRPRR